MVLTLPFKRAVDIAPKPINFPANLRPSQIGVMIVDQSSFFCRPSLSRPANDNTSRVARHNAGLIERFREAGAKIVIVSWTPYRNYKNLNPYGDAKSLERYDVDHCGFERKDGDIHVIKTHNSGFDGTSLNAELVADDLQALFLLGFNTSACIMATGLDAVKNRYPTALLLDGTANDNNNPECPKPQLEKMARHGVSMSTSGHAFDYLEGL